ncbi:ABC transporter, permease protein [Anaerococcus lactolyticus ATCC 51172]|uniref:ABC transporter, permease protein n=1 Tax=Anaerococcus lactolyticus ATCC 51172 TaxID=525254 RepID=C2BFC1_9FIRM|nr:ABC transporter permease [Anaerococcus lactolyticus]EEI86407.1 ABC transporter, permease protein [Anaerococcus lactolyticus ATCC 51172]
MKLENNLYTKNITRSHSQRVEERGLSLRKKTLLLIFIALAFLSFIFIKGSMINDDTLAVDFANKLKAPSLDHLFGTDASGRDMALRTIKGLSNSIYIGIIGSLSSLLIASIFSLTLSLGNKSIDKMVNFIIDIFLSIPHMMLLILISVSTGRGAKGVILGIALTHWTSLTRLLRGEILELKNENYIKISKTLGKSKVFIFIHHILPHIAGQMIVGLILLFPHAILHESAISFLGFGLSLSTPSIGIILSESMKYLLQGHWYLAFFPGLLLCLVVYAINLLGENLGRLLDPYSYHR